MQYPSGSPQLSFLSFLKYASLQPVEVKLMTYGISLCNIFWPFEIHANRSVWIAGKQHMDCVKRIWYLSPMRAAKVQVSLRIRAVSPEPPLLAHTSSESRGTFRQKARSLAPLNGWACPVKICHDGILEDTNLLDVAHMLWKMTKKI